MGRDERVYKIAAALDTETTNLTLADGTHTAFPVVYQVNDLRDVPIKDYEPDGSDSITFFRSAGQVARFVDRLVAWGSEAGCVPVVCGYNLLFDLQTVIYPLRRSHPMQVCAQTATNVYTLDLLADDGKTVLLRFWDTYHLEMNGLAAMGVTAGLDKLKGDWDYTLVRSPETPLSDDERSYAARDVQVIPAYLRYLLEANDWLHESMLGSRVLTKTSLVRRMAENEIGPLECGHGSTVRRGFMALCASNFPSCFADYGLRKACFRGGYTFTSAANASKVVRNVASMDVTSMHHTYICGRCVPEGFEPCDPDALTTIAGAVANTPLETVLARYHKPFNHAFHGRFVFHGLRLKEGSCFARWHIGLAPKSKFQAIPETYWNSEAGVYQEEGIRATGWRDRAINARFAYSKLYGADEAVLHLTEIELWCMAQVYEWDDMRAELGEVTTRQAIPPDYVTLQSSTLFERKQAMKGILKDYEEGAPYPGEIPASIPRGIAALIAKGEASARFLDGYYNSTVKGMFNSVYGTMAQDEMRPDYEVLESAEIQVDRDTRTTRDNFTDRRPKRPKVLYPYGMRIVGGSRMHMVIALTLLDRALGSRVEVCGGDTDSIKVACAPNVTDDDLIGAMAPLETACDVAIDRCMGRVRRNYPDKASNLSGLGHFEVERCGGRARRYPLHIELWNKARVSVDTDGHAHVTMAGLSRPEGTYHIEHWLDDMAAEKGWDWTLTQCVGYGSVVAPELSHSLMRTYPRPGATVSVDVMDHRGERWHVEAPEAVALYGASRKLGDLAHPTNRESVWYLRNIVGTEVRSDERWLRVREGRPWLLET